MEDMYKKEKIKRLITLGVIGLVVIVVFFTLFGDEEVKTPVVEGEIRLVDEKQSLEDGMRARYSTEITNLHEEDRKIAESLTKIEASIAALSEQNKRTVSNMEESLQKERRIREETLKKERDRITEELTKAIDDKNEDTIKRSLDNLKKLQLKEKEIETESLQKEAQMIPPPPGLEGIFNPVPAPAENNASNVNNNAGNAGNAGNANNTVGINTGGYNEEAPIAPPTFQVMTGLIAGADLSQSQNMLQTGEDVKKKKAKKTKKIIVPTGSFAKGRLLSGVIAPTAGKGASDPVPALIRVTGIAQLPNFFKVDFRNCFLLAETKGDLATEKVSFRINKMSCVDNKGNVIEKSVNGYVTGENGMEGLHGRVVSKQGAVLARAFVGTFVGGIGKAFQNATQIQTVTGSGIISTQDANQIWQSGLANGFAESMTRLSDFYMDLADQMVPVIEINAGRNMDIVFIDSIDMSPEANQQAEEEANEIDRGQLVSQTTKPVKK